MKKFNYYSCALLIVALTCVIFAGCGTSTTTSSGSAATVAPSGDAGSLIIHRAANLGQNLQVSIDGAKAGPVRSGGTYTGSLAPGPHVISVLLVPNQLHLQPTVKRLTVEKGKTYTFTAMWEGETLVLR